MKGQKNQAIIIYNILRQIGLSPKIKGTKILVSAIIIALNSSDEIIITANIYNKLSSQYKLSEHSISTAISYTLHHLVGKNYEDNFQEIFGIEYCEDLYTAKTIIEEITRIIKMKVVY